MLTASTEATVEIEGVEYIAACKVTLDLPIDDTTLTLPAVGSVLDVTSTVQSVATDESLTTDLPDSMRDQSGETAKTATIVLAGLVDRTDEDKTISWLLNPFSADSPMFRQPLKGCGVTVSLGLIPAATGGAPELFLDFTGRVSSPAHDLGNATVSLDCVDMRDVLRATAAIAAVVPPAPFNTGVTGEYVMDQLLRNASQGAISSSPPVRPDCVLSATLRSTIVPEIGTFDPAATSSVPLVFAPGAYGTGLGTDFYASTEFTNGLAYALTTPVVEDCVLQCLVDGGSKGVAVQHQADRTMGYYALSVTTSSGRSDPVEVDVSDGTHQDYWAPSIPGGLTDGPYLVAAWVHWPVGGTSWSCTVAVDGVTYSTTRSIGARNSNTLGVALIDGSASADVEGVVAGVQVTNETAPTFEAFTPGAIFDPSLNTLQVVPDIDAGTDAWQEIQNVAEAELGYARFDNAGIFRFTNRTNLRTGSPVRTISALSSLKALDVSQSGSSSYNRIQVPWAGYTVGAAGQVWSLATVWRVPAGQTVVKQVTTDSLVTNIDQTAAILADGVTPTPGASYFRVSSTQAGVASHPGGVSCRITQTQGDQLTITLTNASTVDGYLVVSSSYTDITAGTPFLIVGGQPVTQGDAQTSDAQQPPLRLGGAASSPEGEVAFGFPQSSYVQTQAAADFLANDLLRLVYAPPPDLTDISIVPDPRLETADRVQFVWPDKGIDDPAVIWGQSITVDFDQHSYEHTVDARLVARPGQWILGVPGRTELGLTTYL